MCYRLDERSILKPAWLHIHLFLRLAQQTLWFSHYSLFLPFSLASTCIVCVHLPLGLNIVVEGQLNWAQRGWKNCKQELRKFLKQSSPQAFFHSHLLLFALFAQPALETEYHWRKSAESNSKRNEKINLVCPFGFFLNCIITLTSEPETAWQRCMKGISAPFPSKFEGDITTGL